VLSENTIQQSDCMYYPSNFMFSDFLAAAQFLKIQFSSSIHWSHGRRTGAVVFS